MGCGETCETMRVEADTQRLAALVEGLRGLLHELRSEPDDTSYKLGKASAAGKLDSLLWKHGFAPEAEGVQEGRQEAAEAVASPETGKGA